MTPLAAVTIAPDKHDVRGALAVIAPSVRMSEQRIEEIATITREAASELAMLWSLRQVQRIRTAQARAVA